MQCRSGRAWQSHVLGHGSRKKALGVWESLRFSAQDSRWGRDEGRKRMQKGGGGTKDREDSVENLGRTVETSSFESSGNWGRRHRFVRSGSSVRAVSGSKEFSLGLGFVQKGLRPQQPLCSVHERWQVFQTLSSKLRRNDRHGR
jgi:hypothetical protein